QRSCLVAPMVAGNDVVGYLYADIDGARGRFDVADRRCLATFAAQGAAALDRIRRVAALEREIAVARSENVRLLKEAREALQRETATSEILRVISGSPPDVQPVFDAIAERARLLCGARVGATTRFDGELL